MKKFIVKLSSKTDLSTLGPPTKCSGSSQTESTDKIEMILLNDRYKTENGLGLVISNSSESTFSGHISGISFTGGGSASWSIKLDSDRKSGVLEMSFFNSHTALNGGSGQSTTKYDVTCE